MTDSTPTPPAPTFVKVTLLPGANPRALPPQIVGSSWRKGIRLPFGATVCVDAEFWKAAEQHWNHKAFIAPWVHVEEGGDESMAFNGDRFPRFLESTGHAATAWVRACRAPSILRFWLEKAKERDIRQAIEAQLKYVAAGAAPMTPQDRGGPMEEQIPHVFGRVECGPSSAPDPLAALVYFNEDLERDHGLIEANVFISAPRERSEGKSLGPKLTYAFGPAL